MISLIFLFYSQQLITVFFKLSLNRVTYMLRKREFCLLPNDGDLKSPKLEIINKKKCYIQKDYYK